MTPRKNSPARPPFSALLRAPLMALAALALAGVDAPRAQAIPNNVTFTNYFGSMTFPRPVHFVQYPGRDSSYIVVQQGGKLMTVRRVGGAWARTDSAVITVNGGTSSGNEQGLLGMAFHPNYETTRKYYIYYIGGSGNGVDIIAERTADVSLHPKTSDAQRTLLRLVDPYNNHNGGTLRFGADGYLYFGLGDGGSGGDPQNRAQNLDSLFGKFLRLDVNGADAYPSDTTRNYAIPADNPFVGQANRQPEIWAYGVRNPWKWDFHPTTGDLWMGDVGQDAVEEVSRVPKGGNMGWKIREGNNCYSPSSGCTSAGMTPATIAIAQPTAQSVTGGTFFTGDPTSAYHGVYIFGDYATDSVWAARIVNDSATNRIRIGTVNTISSFNRDALGRVFALNVDNGIISLLTSPDMRPASVSLRPGRAPGAKALRLSDLRRDPAAYEWRTMDGRLLDGFAAARSSYRGTLLVRPRGGAQPAQLVTMVW